VTVRAGERWTARLELDEQSGGQLADRRIDVPGTFLSESAAVHAAESVLNDWRAGRVALRDLVLRELAATYRHLRETHKPMEPVAVPTTSAAWERALALWELSGWLDAAEAARYHAHAQWAFHAAGGNVKRHGLLDARTDPTS
jgi:hypothetical protein